MHPYGLVLVLYLVCCFGIAGEKVPLTRGACTSGTAAVPQGEPIPRAKRIIGKGRDVMVHVVAAIQEVLSVLHPEADGAPALVGT